MLVSITQALEIIDSRITPLQSEIVPIEEAIGRIAADTYTAGFNLPRFDNSAMDGYAVKASDANKRVSCTQAIYAGDEASMIVEAGKAVKIMTGAPIPKGCDAIVPIEDVKTEGEYILLPSSIKEGNFIRLAGEDIEAGKTVLKSGEEINPYTIASLASQGITHVTVFRKIRVAVFGTGDELRPHYEKIEAHQLYNSNSPMFAARSKALGCDVRFIRASADTPEAMRIAISQALDADVIITSGGVSVGDKDFTKEAFTSLGMQIHFEKVDIKPGRPTVFGTIGNTAVINLPGNPLAAMVNYELFVRAVIRKMSGRNDCYHSTVTTVMKNDFNVKGGKTAVLLGMFDAQGFMPLKPQMPGMVSPLAKSDGFILITPEVTALPKGKVVSLLPIKWECTSEVVEEIFCREI